MKQMVFREITAVVNGVTIRRREYLKQFSGGWTWNKKYKYHPFKNHKEAWEVVKRLKVKEGYRNSIEPIDELYYAIIP